MRGVAPPPLEQPPDAGKELLRLPSPDRIVTPPTDLRAAIEQRESVRVYGRQPLSLEELGFLLWCTQGVRKIVPGQATFRTVPSAGARHALETYLLVNTVVDLPPGLYRYLALEHALQEVNRDPDIALSITRACLNQNFVRTSATTFFWTAYAPRMTWRYGERGYRYLFLDAGHVCQNLYLAAEAIQCGVCAIGAFLDAEMNGLLSIDGEKQFLLYLATVGKKR